MDRPTSISVKSVSKDFRLPHEKYQSVKSMFTNLLKRRNRTIEMQHALHDISIEIKKGEFFGIVGRNGSGKSTLLKMLAGIYQPSKGSVEVHGKLVPFIELGVGFNPELSGRDNVYLNGALMGFTKKQIDAQYDNIVQFAELERFMDQKLKNYSSGMQVRLAFSLATRAEADILLVDEVLAVGDAAFQRKCFEYFKDLKARDKTVVFVTHDMSAVREYCDRAVLIENSRLVAEGDPHTIATAYTKMFMPGTDNVTDEEKERGRWGDGKMTITKVEINPKVCQQEDRSLKVSVYYETNDTVHNPVFGIMIKDSSGTAIMGTNTKLKLVKTGEFKAGQTGIVEWTLPNIFNDGQYHLSSAISHEDAITQHDWLENAAHFTVFREDRTAFIVNPRVEVKLT
jgi:ABC-2 type transport system ATP-binding protein